MAKITIDAPEYIGGDERDWVFGVASKIFDWTYYTGSHAGGKPPSEYIEIIKVTWASTFQNAKNSVDFALVFSGIEGHEKFTVTCVFPERVFTRHDEIQPYKMQVLVNGYFVGNLDDSRQNVLYNTRRNPGDCAQFILHGVMEGIHFVSRKQQAQATKIGEVGRSMLSYSVEPSFHWSLS